MASLVQSAASYNSQAPAFTLAAAPVPGNLLIFAAYSRGTGLLIPPEFTLLGAALGNGAVSGDAALGWRRVLPGDGAAWSHNKGSSGSRKAVMMEWSGVADPVEAAALGTGAADQLAPITLGPAGVLGLLVGCWNNPGYGSNNEFVDVSAPATLVHQSDAGNGSGGSGAVGYALGEATITGTRRQASWWGWVGIAARFPLADARPSFVPRFW